MKSKIDIKLTEGERDLLYFYLLGVHSLDDIGNFEEYPTVIDKLEESITEVAKSTRRRRGVKSKMKKLERVKPMALMGMMGEVAPQWVAKELNKIIDHLNSQDQEEECKHNFDLNNRCTKCGVRGVRDMVAELQDTPEEWEKRFKERAERYYEDGSWVDIDSLVGFIKQLLEEKEKEVLSRVDKGQT